jgi:hypothetical protein
MTQRILFPLFSHLPSHLLPSSPSFPLSFHLSFLPPFRLVFFPPPPLLLLLFRLLFPSLTFCPSLLLSPSPSTSPLLPPYRLFCFSFFLTIRPGSVDIIPLLLLCDAGLLIASRGPARQIASSSSFIPPLLLSLFSFLLRGRGARQECVS